MKILISQQVPALLASFEPLQTRFGATVDFHPFYLIETVSAKEFRAERINLPDYTAIVFSSKHAIDAYFELCELMRFKVPETMKYLCSTEAVAMYLQKHIVYRKREKFLIASSVGSNLESLTTLLDQEKLDYNIGVLVKAVSQDLHGLDLTSYDMIVMYNPYDVISLRENFPDFQQGDIKFVPFGKSIVKALEDEGFTIAIKAPTPEATSAGKAIELYLESRN